MSPIDTSHSPVLGTDGLYHLVYELELTNTKTAPATLRRIDVLDADAPSHVLASYMDREIVARLRTLEPQPVESAVIEPNSSRLLYIELAFRTLDEVPRAITHHLYVLGAANPGTSTPTPLDYTAGRLTLNRAPLPVLGPPLAGDGWVATNGCCNSGIVHRGFFQSINGGLYDTQRFAIDYMRLNDQGELVHGDPSDVHNYVDYGADVFAVADGTVVATLTTLADQPPGTLPASHAQTPKVDESFARRYASADKLWRWDGTAWNQLVGLSGLIQVDVGDANHVCGRDSANTVHRFDPTSGFTPVKSRRGRPQPHAHDCNVDGTLWHCNSSNANTFRFISEATAASATIQVQESGVTNVQKVASIGFGAAEFTFVNSTPQR